ncbi:hypothetical protein, partial [Flagellimonas marinaquae]
KEKRYVGNVVCPRRQGTTQVEPPQTRLIVVQPLEEIACNDIQHQSNTHKDELSSQNDGRRNSQVSHTLFSTCLDGNNTQKKSLAIE